MKIRNILILLATMSVAWVATAQRVSNTSAYPRLPIDTLESSTEGVKIITFTNNTWEYYFPEREEWDKNEIFTENWVTDKVAAYKDDVKTLPDEMELTLIDDFDDFHPPYIGKVYSRYGYRGRRAHGGTDIPLDRGDPIYSTFAGKVRYAKYNSGGYGYLVIVRHFNGLETYYGHLSAVNVAVDDYVAAGQVIGYGGNTGRSTGPHLHYEMRYRGMTFDPERLIDFQEGFLRFQTFAIEKSYFKVNSRADEMLEEYDDELELFAQSGDELTSEDILNNIEKAEAERAAEAEPKYYTIKRGDNLGSIARRHGISINELCRLNGIKSTSTIYAGKRLRVK
ncbi:MAG: peptidoglycan DD-metalloendopeptidase family protein [Tidjanibacter sp.]|nr:peptidoglycan DD-metalloendopeptidase family protein [Tidjanibacter sp.]